MLIAHSAFRQYDIRGKVDHELPISQIYRLTCALAAYILQQNKQAKTVIIGRDGRVHSPHIHQQVVQAFFDCGFTVHDTGICPTPVIYFACHTRGYDAAVMITASHNGPEYNGLKLCLGKNSIWADEIQKIKELYFQDVRGKCTGSGSVSRVVIQYDYTIYLAEKFADLKNYPYSLAVDCGNGAVGALIQDVIDAIGLPQVTLLCQTVDGTYPHHPANPVEKENMEHVASYVKEHATYLAVGFDGDGDRMAAMTHEGDLVVGDQLLALFAQDILTTNRPKGPSQATVVFDSKCLMTVPETIKKYGGNPLRSPSGHAHIKAAMREKSALLGGELSCHFFFADDYFGFDDGIYAFLRLLRLVRKSGKTLAELIKQFPQTYAIPEVRIFCPDDEKKAVVNRIKEYFLAYSEYELSFDDGVRFENSASWGLIRVSHTQPAICIRYESLTIQELQKLKRVVYDALQVTSLAPHITSEVFMKECI